MASSATTSQWSPLASLFERMACCATKTESLSNLVVVEDDDDIVIRRSSAAATRQPQPLTARSPTRDLPSPTLSPSRRDLEPWEDNAKTTTDNTTSCCSRPSYPESIATAETMQSEDDDDDDDVVLEFVHEEIKSTATTQVISHRNNPVLNKTLSLAEKQLKQRHSDEQEGERVYRHLTRPFPPRPKPKR